MFCFTEGFNQLYDHFGRLSVWWRWIELHYSDRGFYYFAMCMSEAKLNNKDTSLYKAVLLNSSTNYSL